MINTMVAIRNNEISPDKIFGPNLTSWFDARFGVTDVAGEVTNWVDRSPSSNDLTGGVTGAVTPNLVQPDGDSSASIDYLPTETGALQFSSTKAIGSETTVYVFMDLDLAGDLKNLLWSAGANSGFFVHGNLAANKRPAIFSNGTWQQDSGSPISGWTLLRFNARESDNFLSMAVNADTEQTFTLSWSPVTNSWDSIGRNTSLQNLEGRVKQIIITNNIITDASSEDTKVKSWLKSVYPSLVTF